MSEVLSQEQNLDIPNVLTPLYSPSRYKVLYGGRGGAKSWAIADALILKAWQRSNTLILCTRELQKSIKESVHALLKNRIEAMGFEDDFEVLATEIRCTNGSRFIFAGLKHHISEIKSTEGVDYCWVEEAEKVTHDSWKTLIPTIRGEDEDAGWESEIWVSFNPNLITDDTYQRFVVNPPSDAWVQKTSWRDNPWFPNVLRKEMEDDKARDYEEYLHTWEGELKTFADGAIYGKQLRKLRKKRLCKIPVESGIEVHTFWDLGRDDDTAIWFMQCVGREYRFIDYYSARFKDIDHYARVIKEKDYNYGTHYMPHDVSVQVLGMKKNRKAMFEEAGVKPIKKVDRIPNILDGITMVRQILDSCWIDEDRCKEGFAALANYQRQYDEERDTYAEKPLHNWASNGSDAFRQFAQGFRMEEEINTDRFEIPQTGQGWKMG